MESFKTVDQEIESLVKEGINGGEDEILDLGETQIQNVIQVDKEFIQRFTLDVDEAQNTKDLVDTCEKGFSTLVGHANTISSRQMSKELQLLASNILQKIRSINDSIKTEGDGVQANQNEVYDKVFDTLIANIAELEGVSEQKMVRLTFSAAFGLTHFILALIQKNTPAFSLESASAIMTVVHYLETNQKLFAQLSKQVYGLFKKFRDYNEDKFLTFVLDSFDKKSKHAFLALLAKDRNDHKLMVKLSESFNQLVLNDKDRLSNEHLTYFIHFLNSIDEKFFSETVLSQIEFMLKRNGLLIPVISQIFEHLNTVAFSIDLTKVLIEKVLTEDVLNNQEFASHSYLLFKNVALRVNSQDSAKAIIEHLIKKFQAQKTSAQFPTKQNIVKIFSATIQYLPKGQLPQDSLNLVLINVLEHVNSIKEDGPLKDIFSYVQDLFRRSETYQFLVDPLKKLAPRTANYYQIALFNELIEAKRPDLGDVIQVLFPQVKKMLNDENYKITANYSTILTYGAFMCVAYQYTNDRQFLQTILSNENLLNYVTTSKGFINTPTYFQKDPSFLDTKHHLKLIEVLLVHHYSESHLSQGDGLLRETLFEYLLNQTYKFREHQVFNTFEAICANSNLANANSNNLIKTLYIKVKQVSLRPYQASREEIPHQSSLSAVEQVRITLKFILKNRTTDFAYEEFMSLLKIISHPYISSDNKRLMRVVKALEEAIGVDRLRDLIQQYAKQITEYSVTQRTGILSSDPTIRKIGINMAVILASQKQLDLYLQDLVKILDYKPFELISKLSALFEQEFDRISHYDLMFYSEITKDLQKVFKEIDAPIIAKELETQQSQEEEKKGEEEVSEAPIDPVKLQAQLLKQQAAMKKAGAAKKGTKPAAATKAAPAKEAPKKPTSEKKPVESSQPPMDKEKRNKLDRKQLLDYFSEITAVKGRQIEAVYEILKRVNKNDFCLDNTLQYLLLSIVRLLNYQGSRFATTLCLQSLFASHKTDHLFPVKNEVVSCLIAISQGRIYLKHQREFQQIFHHVESNTNLDFYDKGHIDLLLLMGNNVLKDMSVNLSVKEQALSVIQSFLSTDKVNDIELVRVTINMMKSSYNSKNLQSYLNELIRRLRPEHIALILQRLFEYEPIPRIALLKELLEYDEPLFCPVWLSTQIWVLQFEEECSKYARKLWNKYGMALRTASLDIAHEEQYRNMYYYLRSKNTAIYEATLRAVVASIEIFQNRYDLIVDDLIEFYNKEMVLIQQEGLIKEQQKPEFQGGRQSKYGTDIVGDERLNRMAVAEIIKRTAHLVQANSFKKIFEFFITKGCLDNNEEVQRSCMAAAQAVITAKGTDYAEEILKILEKYINEQKKYSEFSKNQAIIMIGHLAQYLDNTSQKKLVTTFEKMLELLNTPSELIRQSICKVIPQLARFFDDKSKKFLEDNFKILRESQDEKLLRGSAFAVAGIIKGLGLTTLTQMDILPIIHKECFSKHADPLRKVSGLYLYETLSISLGKVFEMNIEKILPNIMLCISDSKENVRRAAILSNKTIMGRLSNHAIKQVLPIFLNGLYVENWRSKLASVEALGNMAYCAPRQISAFLPRIVKGIREVLNDTHEKVHAAALYSIQNIGGVIKCPEIADILEILVKALSNPTLHLKPALKLLLETSFVHAIDAPSLSLLVPILDNGLMMHDNESKQLASRLMGNICNLTQDPSDLLPYIKILMPAIRNSLFDSIPEIRYSAAKALGSLSSGLGKDNSSEMVVWLDSVLHQRALQVSERQGAAQGFAEMTSVHGQSHFEHVIKVIITKANDPDAQIRESFRSVLVYLATSFDKFVQYLPELLPIMIQGLSDDSEEVRKVSMKNVKICIKHYGKQAPNQLVDPILRMMFHADFRVRQSSSILMYQLTKELENDIIKLQPKYISIETKQDILSAMFILRYDIIERVSLQASQIWKNIIDNQLKIVKQVLPVLIRQNFDLIQNESLELSEMGLNCMRGIVEKFGEKVVTETIDILENFMERATQVTQTIGISKAIYNMVYAAPVKLLTDLRQRFLTMMDTNLHHENEEIRKLSGQVYLVVFQKTFEPNFMTQFLDKSFLKKLNHLIAVKEEKESELLIDTLKFMLRENPDLKLEDKLIRLCKLDTHEVPLTIAQSKILAAVAPKIAANMFKKKFYQTVLAALQKELTQDAIDDEVRVAEVLKTFSEVISQVNENEIVTINEQIIADFHFRCKDKGRLSFYVDFVAYYCSNSKVNYEKYASQYLSNVLILMNDKDDKLVDKVIKSFNSIINGLQKENQFTHIPLIKDVIEKLAVDTQVIRTGKGGDRTVYRKKVATIKMLEKVDGVKTLSTVIQNSITHGSLDIRIDSAICFQYLVDFSKIEAIKTELIKICGALIRVVNDKFAPALKLQIFSALKLILIKTNILVKAMAPQLQTTFLKAFSDSSAIPVVRKVVVECLVLFLKIAMKIDPIVKELATLIEGDKIDNDSKVEASEVLAVIIRLNGKTIQQAMAQQIQSTLMSIIQTKRTQFNERTLANCAVAVAFLAAYQPDQKQTLQLFESMDSTFIPAISLGLKYGVLLNGVDLPERAKLIEQVESHTLDLLKGTSGLEEVDGHSNYDEKALEEDSGKLFGTLEVLAHIGDVFLRRYGNTASLQELYIQHFRVVNKVEIFKKMNGLKEINKNTFTQVIQYLSEIPIQFQAGSKDLDAETKQVLKDGMDFIRAFYLDQDSKRDAYPAVANMFMLNYNNYLDVNDEKLELLTVEKVRDVIYNEPFKSVISENLRSLAVELIFI